MNISAIRCAMPSTGLLTTDDLDEISRVAFDVDLPLDLAADLVGAVDQDLVVDQVDTGYVLGLAAELTERDGSLREALLLADRAIETHRAHGEPDGYPRAFRARLLLMLGREDEAMAELMALRPLLPQDPDAVAYICDALEAGDRAETAEQWLTAALATVLQRQQELESQRGGADYGHALGMAFVLAQSRHRIRGDLDLPYDDYDCLTDRLMSLVQAVFGDEDPDYEEATLLFWPQPEFDRLLLRWPSLAEEYGPTWDEYRTTVEEILVVWSESSHLHFALRTGVVEELATHAERIGGDPIDPQVRQDYALDLTEPLREIAWPPARNDLCWCGSLQEYQECCLPRART